MRICQYLISAFILAVPIGGLATEPKNAGESFGGNTRTIQRYFDEVWNQGKVDVLDELLTPDYQNHSSSIPNPRPGAEDLKLIVRAMRKGIPDLHYEILDIVQTSTKAAIYLRVTGTHSGDFFGMAPTGTKFDVRQMQIEWLKDGKIWQHWRVTEDFGFAKRQL